MTQTSDRSCPVCPQERLNFYYSGSYTGCGVVNYSFSLLHCSSCDLYTVDPMPSNEVYPLSRDDKKGYVGKPMEQTLTWNVPLLNNIKKYVEAGDLLDLGCNAGEFFPLAEQNGFRCTGIEIDEVASQEAQRQGRNVIQGDFLGMQFDKKFDVIVMNHVLEHIPDFTKLPAKLATLLKPGGVAVLNVPYFHSWLGQLLKRKWSQMAPFTHIWFYSKESIHKMFDPHFGNVELFTDSSCEPHTTRTTSWKPLVKGLAIEFFTLLRHGDELRIVLRNPK